MSHETFAEMIYPPLPNEIEEPTFREEVAEELASSLAEQERDEPYSFG